MSFSTFLHFFQGPRKFVAISCVHVIKMEFPLFADCLLALFLPKSGSRRRPQALPLFLVYPNPIASADATTVRASPQPHTQTVPTFF